jgi:hypothetical protein
MYGMLGEVFEYILLVLCSSQVLAVDQGADGLAQRGQFGPNGLGRRRAHLLDLGSLDLETMSDLRYDLHDPEGVTASARIDEQRGTTTYNSEYLSVLRAFMIL